MNLPHGTERERERERERTVKVRRKKIVIRLNSDDQNIYLANRFSKQCPIPVCTHAHIHTHTHIYICVCVKRMYVYMYIYVTRIYTCFWGSRQSTPEQCDIHTHQQGHNQYMQPHHHSFNHTLMNHN